jgi:RND family efflux transporter MFP subunit
MSKVSWPVVCVTFLIGLCGMVFLRADDVDVDSIQHQLVLMSEIKHTNHYEVRRRLSGKVRARQHADLGFEQGGKLAEILVDEGVRIAKGDVLAVLDVDLLTIERQELDAQLRDARARLQLTINNLQRQVSLKKSGYTSEQRLDELQTERLTLLAKISSLDASLASLFSRMKKSSLVAPFDGVVTGRYADQGAVVHSGATVMRIQQLGIMEVHLGVPSRLIDTLLPGESVTVQINDQFLQAIVMAVGAHIDAITRTANVRIALPQGVDVVDGDLAFLEVTETINAEGFWLPATAVTDGVRGLWVVYVLDQQESGALAESKNMSDRLYQLKARNVDVLYASGDLFFVAGDIADGALVVTDGILKVVPEQIVNAKFRSEPIK